MDDPEIELVVANERRLHAPEVRSSRDAVSDLLDQDFREVGASGRVWDRASVLDAMAREDAPLGVVVQDMVATRLAPTVILLTYRCCGPNSSSLRSSIWRRTGDRWTVYFHQGTPRPDR